MHLARVDQLVRLAQLSCLAYSTDLL